jgi:hypothetical protein
MPQLPGSDSSVVNPFKDNDAANITVNPLLFNKNFVQAEEQVAEVDSYHYNLLLYILNTSIESFDTFESYQSYNLSSFPETFHHFVYQEYDLAYHMQLKDYSPSNTNDIDDATTDGFSSDPTIDKMSANPDFKDFIVDYYKTDDRISTLLQEEYRHNGGTNLLNDIPKLIRDFFKKRFGTRHATIHILESEPIFEPDTNQQSNSLPTQDVSTLQYSNSNTTGALPNDTDTPYTHKIRIVENPNINIPFETEPSVSNANSNSATDGLPNNSDSQRPASSSTPLTENDIRIPEFYQLNIPITEDTTNQLILLASKPKVSIFPFVRKHIDLEETIRVISNSFPVPKELKPDEITNIKNVLKSENASEQMFPDKYFNSHRPVQAPILKRRDIPDCSEGITALYLYFNSNNNDYFFDQIYQAESIVSDNRGGRRPGLRRITKRKGAKLRLKTIHSKRQRPPVSSNK